MPPYFLPDQLLVGKDDCSPTSVEFDGPDPNTVSFSCADLMGAAFLEVFVPVTVTDTFGNSFTCNSQIILLNDNCMTAPLASVTGQLMRESNIGVPDATIQVSSDMMDTTVNTIEHGYYVLPELEMYQDYTITPSSDVDPSNGVNTLDLILIARHILALETLDSPYKIIAADANRSGNISIADMLDLSRLILNIESSFPNNTSWRFIDSHYEFNDPTQPLNDTFPESMLLPNLEQSFNDMDFIAVKTGDVNNSATLSNFTQQGDTREDNSLTIQLEDQLMQAGESYVFEFKVKEFQQLLGYQFTLDFDPSLIEFEGIEEDRSDPILGLSEQNFGLSELQDGKIRTNWFHPQVLNLVDETTLFAIRFKAKTEIPISRVITINSSALAAEAYDVNQDKLAIDLEFTELPNEVTTFKLYQNRPNPFQDLTIIPFLLPKEGLASLRIMDVSGRIVYEQEQNYQVGYHEVIIEKSNLPENGLFFYQLKIGKQEATKKMMLSH